MFIISQLKYGDYLHKPCYTAAAAAAGVQLPKPEDLGQQYRRGDFDVLIIHRTLVGQEDACTPDPNLSEDIYLDIVSRAPPLVCLTGPPGTGKSVVLVIMALVWLRDGHDVHVVSLRPGSLAMALLICHQLEMTMKADPTTFSGAGAVHLHYFDLQQQPGDLEKVVRDLVAASTGQELHLIMDEAVFDIAAWRVVLDAGFLRVCPIQPHFLRRICLVAGSCPARSHSSSFRIFSGHRMLKMRLRQV
nr:hypothetical protein BaRGS_020696 [Batillaria attramentaria]